VEFVVIAVVVVPKDAFPTNSVYGTVRHPALRLITCGGTYDRSRQSYPSNIVVYATRADFPLG
jgi:hypothetical protein